VLVTRPVAQAAGLAALIQAAGGEPILFPVLEIAPPSDLAPLYALIDRLDGFDIAIFISPNAVSRSLNLIHARRGGLPAGLRLATVGRGSARELQRMVGRPPDLCPQERFESEALLQLPEFQAIAGLRVVIFRGEGGRELLADTLRERGAVVEYAEVYRRAVPNLDVGLLLRRWSRGDVGVVTITSSEGLRNLFDRVGQLGQAWLRSTPLIVINPRQAELARELGIREIGIASQASDEAILAAICAWRITHSPAPPGRSLEGG